MTSNFVKSVTLATLATALIVSVTPALAQDYGDVMYERYYYDDAGMTQQVGYERDTCTRYGVGGSQTQGRYGPYVQENPIAYCNQGQISPY